MMAVREDLGSASDAFARLDQDPRESGVHAAYRIPGQASGTARLIRDLLPILDRLAHDDREHLEQVLENHGLERILATDGPFDPDLHHVADLAEVEAAEGGGILSEVACGYRFGPRVLRKARVVLGHCTQRKSFPSTRPTAVGGIDAGPRSDRPAR
jgi:hypothetical protein